MTSAPTHLSPVVTAEELIALLSERPDLRLLDVRTAGEFETAHISGAYNVPLDTLAEHGPEIQAAIQQPLVLVCQSGGRARQAEAVLKRAGMPNLHVLEDGMNGWLAAGKPVVRRRRRLPLERQVRIAAGALAAAGGLLALAASPAFALLPLAVGGGLVFAGLTDRCGLALMIGRLPWNQPATCDVAAMVQALKTGAPPASQRPAAEARAVTACSQ